MHTYVHFSFLPMYLGIIIDLGMPISAERMYISDIPGNDIYFYHYSTRNVLKREYNTRKIN